MKAQNNSGTGIQKVNSDRAFFETLGGIYPVNNDIVFSEEYISGTRCYWFKPSTAKKEEITVYVHGGSFALGSYQSHKAMVSHIAQFIQTDVLFIEYSLAPEHPYPVAINEVIGVYKELLKKYPPGKISFIGDSAGGAILVSVIYACTGNDIALPGAVVLISPWLNLKCNTNSYKTRQALDPILTKADLLTYAQYYAGNTTGEADPNELIFKAFPPVFLLAGSREILHDDAKNFFEYIQTIQHKAAFKVYEDQTHVWLLTNINAEKSREALQDIKDFLHNRH